MKNILIDSGFWFALYNERDDYHNEAIELFNYLDLGIIIIPFPSLYETINTRFAKNIKGFTAFSQLIETKRIELRDDDEYKSKALELTKSSILKLNKPYSLVDMVIRLMLEDKRLKIDYLISFNPGDFIDVCNKNQIEILSS